MSYLNPDAGLRALVTHTERSQRALREEGERLHCFVVVFRAVVRELRSSTSTVTPATPVFNVGPPLPTSPRLEAEHINRIHYSAGPAWEVFATIMDTSASFTLRAARAFSPVKLASLAHKPSVHLNLCMGPRENITDVSARSTQPRDFEAARDTHCEV
jgi:hypothetical protein